MTQHNMCTSMGKAQLSVIPNSSIQKRQQVLLFSFVFFFFFSPKGEKNEWYLTNMEYKNISPGPFFQITGNFSRVSISKKPGRFPCSCSIDSGLELGTPGYQFHFSLGSRGQLKTIFQWLPILLISTHCPLKVKTTIDSVDAGSDFLSHNTKVQFMYNQTIISP